MSLPIRFSDILTVTANYFDVSEEDVCSGKRARLIMLPRQVVCHLAYDLTASSLADIGRRLGNRNHATILHSVRVIKRDLHKDPVLSKAITDITSILIPMALGDAEVIPKRMWELKISLTIPIREGDGAGEVPKLIDKIRDLAKGAGATLNVS